MPGTVTTTKAINLEQLTAEAGGPLSMRAEGVERVITAETLTQAQLETAVGAHVASPTLDENATTLRDRLRTALAVNASFVNANKPATAAGQASAAYDQAVRLARQNNALIRLIASVLNTTDGT